jgi:hypothetical protein
MLVQQESLHPGFTPEKALCKTDRWDYGVAAGDGSVVVVVSDSVIVVGDIVVVAGDIVVVAGDIVVVGGAVIAPAGDGFTIVVFDSAGTGDVVVVGWTSVRCSHAVRSAALASMQIYFFMFWIGWPVWVKG